MKRTRVVALGFLWMLSSGCGQVEQHQLNEQHQQYLSDKGWEIKEPIEAKTIRLDIPNKRLSNLRLKSVIKRERQPYRPQRQPATP